MTQKVGRNAPCPCGSGKKHKKCCLGKEDNPEYSDPSKFPLIYKSLRKEARFKECIHPNKIECSETIISAHSIQNNKILSKISDNGKVFMPCPKPDLTFTIQKEYGRKEASTFTGFCGFHDKTLFQPIEDCDFIGTNEQIFLYIYRAFAMEYHKKKEAVRIEQAIFAQKPSIATIPDRAIDGRTGFDMAVSDYEEEKTIFDSAILNRDYNVLTSIVWQFDGFSNFAASAGEAPSLDFNSYPIQDLLNPNIPVRHIYISVFPENEKTNVIIAWLKKYDVIFATIKQKLDILTEQEKKNYVNNTLPFIAENIAIKPSKWEALSEQAKEEFSMIFCGLPELGEMEGKKFDRFQKPSFDLFSL